MIGRPLNPWKKGRKKDEFTRDLITMATSNLLTAKRIVILDSLRAIAAWSCCISSLVGCLSKNYNRFRRQCWIIPVQFELLGCTVFF